MAQLRSRLKAFTIVETLVALSLIAISLALAFMLFSHTAIGQLEKNGLGLRADEVLRELHSGERELVDQELSEFTEEQQRRGIRGEVEVKPYEEQENLFLVRVAFFKAEEILYEQTELIAREHED